MAAFTDQFERRRPLRFVVPGVINFWLQQAAWEARSILRQRSEEDVVGIARAIEQIVSQYAERLTAPDAAHAAAETAKLMAVAGGPDEARHHHGDLNLYRAAGGISALIGHLQKGVDPTEAEALAVLALWKIVDALDALSAPRRKVAQPSDAQLKAALYQASPYAIEASRAAAAAVELHIEARRKQAGQTAIDELMADWQQQQEKMRSEAASKRGQMMAKGRHAATYRARDAVLAWVADKRFESRLAAARKAVEYLATLPDVDPCQVEAVDGWLKKAGWKPKH